MIRLIDVNEDNWRLELKVSQLQKRYVADSTVLLARAYAFRNARSKAFIIYNDELPVGMALYYDWAAGNAYNFSQLLIDERYQRKRYGYLAAQSILAQMKADGKYNKVVLCYIEGNEAARKLFEKVGFRLTGERDEDEIIMEKPL